MILNLFCFGKYIYFVFNFIKKKKIYFININITINIIKKKNQITPNTLQLQKHLLPNYLNKNPQKHLLTQ